MSKYNTLWLVQTLKDRNIQVIPLENYIDDKTPITFKCNICDNIWKVDPSHLKGGRTCPNCRKIAKQNKFKDEFISKAKVIHNNFYSYGKVIYTKQQNKVLITCPIHGDFEQTPNSHLQGRGCPLCAGNNFLRDTNYFIQLAKKVHGNDFNYDKVIYKTCKDPVVIHCNTCNQDFEQTPDGHLQGKGCPKCKLKSQRNLYKELIKIFPDLNIKFEVGNKVVPWLGLQRFDIYILDLNVAIEYDGAQHYIPIEHFGGELGLKQTQERDRLKEQKCVENGCKLFRLRYDYTEKDFNALVNNIKTLINGRH